MIILFFRICKFIKYFQNKIRIFKNKLENFLYEYKAYKYKTKLLIFNSEYRQ